MKRPGGVLIFLGVILLLLVVGMVLCAPLLTDGDPIEQNTRERFLSPSWTHPFGTDHFGRDIFARVLYGGRITLPLALLTLLLTSAIGVVIGLVSGLNQGKWIDVVLMRTVDVLIAIPFIVVAMAVTSIFGRGFFKILYLVVALWWAPFARYTRSLVLSEKNREAVMAAKILGAGTLTIVFHEIFLRILFPLVIYVIFEFGSLIASLATLSFFGMGAQPPTPEWGSMLSDGRGYYLYSVHILLWPSVFIFCTVMGLNLLGEGLRDRFAPFAVLETDGRDER